MALGALGVFVVALIFGGASQRNELRVAAVELAGLPLLGYAAATLFRTSAWRGHRYALGLCLFCLALPLLQLIPLPPGVWQALPGREQMALALSLAGEAPGWAPISLTPEATWGSFLALIPPLAVFLAAIQLSPDEQRVLALAVVLGALASIGLGILQIAAGGRGPLYLYEISSFGSAVGFFANRNHLATLLLVSLPLAAALAPRPGEGRNGLVAVFLPMLAVLLAVVALGVVRSRAGVILGLPALGGAAYLYWRRASSGGAQRWGPVILLSLIAIGGAAAVAALQLQPLLDRFSGDHQELRFGFWRDVVRAANAYLPVGSGMGSFIPVYGTVEDPHLMDERVLNRAHNDYLELWLEAGWMAAAGLVAFVVWLAKRARAAFAVRTSGTTLWWGATMGLLLILAHSAFDYPMRTETIACVFAVLAAITGSGASEGQAERRRAAPVDRVSYRS